jgi:hypothetical protein
MSPTEVRNYLDRFYGFTDPYVEYDDPTTTFIACGAAIITSILMDSISAQSISVITRLPVNFVAAVMVGMEVQSMWDHERTAGLRDALGTVPEDFADVSNALLSVLEEFGSPRRMTPDFQRVLESFRSGFLVGGGRQHWIDSGTHEAPE